MSKLLTTEQFSEVLDRGITIDGYDYSRFSILGGDSPGYTHWVGRQKALPKVKSNTTTILEPWWKPRTSLWYGCNSEWLQFLTYELTNQLTSDMYVYALDVRRVYSKSELRPGKPAVLCLTQPEAVVAFGQRYGALSRDGYINWPEVQKTYAGVEICPYQGSLRLEMDWYYVWDVASGAVWDSRAVYDSHLFAYREGEDEYGYPMWRTG